MFNRPLENHAIRIVWSVPAARGKSEKPVLNLIIIIKARHVGVIT